MNPRFPHQMTGFPNRYIRNSSPAENHCPRRLMGHSHGLDVHSPSFGLSPEFPCNITRWDSINRFTKPGAMSARETLGSFGYVLSSTFHREFGSRGVGLHATSPCS